MVLMNLTPGGLFGYCSSKCMTNLNVPSSKGVSDGPMITAFLYNLLGLCLDQSFLLPWIFGNNIAKGWAAHRTKS